jgi:hypothetical protein
MFRQPFFFRPEPAVGQAILEPRPARNTAISPEVREPSRRHAASFCAISSLRTIDGISQFGFNLSNSDPKRIYNHMKHELLAGIIASGAALTLTATHANAQTVLFSDNYNRANSINNLTPTFAGQAGVDSPLSYIIPEWSVPGSTSATNSMQVFNNNLFKAQTGQEGIWALNQNFTDSSILSSGGFSVSQNILNIGANGSDQQDRYCGYGVGLSLAQISAFADEGSTTLGPRGNIAAGTFGVAPFYVDLSLTDEIQVFANNTVSQFAVAPGTDASGGTLATTFSFADFNQGSTVNYDVTFNGTNITSGTFDWDSTTNNYIVGSMRSSTVTASTIDVSTLASTPEPTTVTLGVCGAVGLALRLRRRK